MSQNPFKTKKFEELKSRWYKKLESSGFVDCEQDEDNLKEWDAYAFRSRYSRHLYDSKETYYRLAGQFLHQHTFADKRERLIWEAHSNGKSVTAISEELKRRNFKLHSRTNVYYVIKALAKEMLKINGITTNNK